MFPALWLTEAMRSVSAVPAASASPGPRRQTGRHSGWRWLLVTGVVILLFGLSFGTWGTAVLTDFHGHGVNLVDTAARWARVVSPETRRRILGVSYLACSALFLAVGIAVLG